MHTPDVAQIVVLVAVVNFVAISCYVSMIHVFDPLLHVLDV